MREHGCGFARPVAALLRFSAVFSLCVMMLGDAAAQPNGAENNGAGQRSAEVVRDELGRRTVNGEPTVLAFDNVSVERIVPFIVEATGKVVLPQPDVLPRRVTIINDQPIPRQRALDLVLLALHQAGVAVIETDEVVMLRDLSDLRRQDVPVIGARVSVLGRPDTAVVAEKIYQLQFASAENLGTLLKDQLPEYATMGVDKDSNQLVVRGTIGLLQRVERVVEALDQPAAQALQSATFRLRFADAQQIADNINQLYGSGTTTTGARTGAATTTGRGGQQTAEQQRNQRIQAFFQQQQQQQGRGGAGGAGGEQAAATSANLRVTANSQQNVVTVLAEADVIEQIRRQIEQEWDLPLPEEAVVPRIYDLKNSDPVKVRDLLEQLFGSGGTGAQSASQGVGRLAGQFRFEAIAESGRLVVVGRSPDNLSVIDRIIEDLDRPQNVGLPRVIELKHASAEELAEQLNALLSQEGTLAQIPRLATGLTQDTSSASPFAAEQTATAAAAAATSPGTITFWWQRARPPTDSVGAGALVGKIRIVPVWRQNAVMLMAPQEYMSSVEALVMELDKPGRQVLISAIIAEISVDDAEALGLRWSSLAINPTRGDNAISIGAGFQGQQDDAIRSLFDTSVLNVNANLNLLLQALSEKTNVNILSEPRIFTSDNQEATFFDGQDIPFITNSQTTDIGTLNQSFDYRAVGIQLRVRPRITVNRDVDLRINLELSSIVPGQALFGGFIVDRRETTTHLIVRDGQTAVISGILRNEVSEIRRKVPLLGDIPLIGALFTSKEDANRRTELVAFITPIVITNPEEFDDANRPFRERLDGLRGTMGMPEIDG